MPSLLYLPSSEKIWIAVWPSRRFDDVEPRPSCQATPYGKSRNGIGSDVYLYAVVVADRTRIDGQPRRVSGDPLVNVVDGRVEAGDDRGDSSALPAPPGCNTPTRRRPGEMTEASARCRLSGSAVPPWLSTQLAIDSFAARPTATTSWSSLRRTT